MPRPTGQAPSRFFRRATVWLPTWRLTLPVLLLLVGLSFILIRSTHDFLSVNAPVRANVLVVEGWSPDLALEESLAEFRRGSYDWLIASGGPMERGSLVSGFATYAEIAGASLRAMGVDPARLLVAPAPRQFRNRTFVSAVSVRETLATHSIHPKGVNIISVGPHARRSWVVYQEVLGDQCPVGILALPPQDYDAKRWWASSDGVKGTITEAVGWLYERLFDGGREPAPLHADATRP